MDEEYKKWLAQYRKGYIELCTLITLKSKGSMHGLAIIRLFEEMDLPIKEGTLYPLLNRMEQNGWLSSQWNIPKSKGHPKREYFISKKGEQILPRLVEAQESHQNSIAKIKEMHHEH